MDRHHHQCNMLLFVFIIALRSSAVHGYVDTAGGPMFIQEPANSVEFLNTTGTIIFCTAQSFHGPPKINWFTRDGLPISNDISGLRYVRSDGSLIFSPFQPQHYIPDVHSNIYKCHASNHIGTVVSRECHVRAVLRQEYTPEVYDEYIIEGNTAVMKCVLPSYVKDFVTVLSWIREPNMVIQLPSLATNDISRQSVRYMMLQSGELLIRDVRMSDSHHKFKCQTKHKLTGEIVISNSAGKIIVTESFSGVPPRISHLSSRTIVEEGTHTQLVCIAQGWPQVSYQWSWVKDDISLQLRHRHKHAMAEESGILIIDSVERSDSGKYICHINNTSGKERGDIQLLVKAPLSATISPVYEVVRSGQSVTFNCTTSGYPILSIVWLKDGRMITDNSRVRFEVNGHSLHIKSVRRQDAAIYQCLVKGSGIENVQASAILAHGDDPPKFLEVFRTKELQPGEFVSMKCMATGTPLPMVTWLLDEIPPGELDGIRQGDYVTKDGNVVSFVNITSVRTEHGGEWTCIARSEVGDIRYSAILTIFGPPHVRPMPNMTLVANDALQLKCPVGGVFEDISWEKNGIRLPDNHRQVLHPNGTLIIKDLSRETDEGRYTCIARNKGEQSKGSLFITVRVKPIIEPFTLPNSVHMGQRLSITCTVAQGDVPLIIKWLHDDEIIEEDNSAKTYMRIYHMTDYSSTLLFESVRHDHKGNYTCVASNNVGEDRHSASMIIHEKPRWIIEPTDHGDLIQGNNAWIDCAATGSPMPKVIWKRAENISAQYKPITSSFHVQVLENGTLFIEGIDKKDSGLYLCHVSNGIGADLSKIIRVQVHVAARFKSKFRAETFQRTQRASLICEGIGERPINIQWFRDKQAMSLDSSRFTIKETVLNEGITSELVIGSIDRSDSALYQCITTNAYGKDETSIQVIVQEPPDTPIDVKLSDISSRSLRLSWSPPFSGNSRLTKYHIYLEECGRNNEPDSETMTKRSGQFRNITIPASEISWAVSDLSPLTNYSISVAAVNSLGISELSSPITFHTEEEVPNGPPRHIKAHPTSSSTIRVIWKAPENRINFGTIRGYYIGYKVSESTDTYIYKTLEVTDTHKGEAILRNLNRFTKYVIVVQAFNTKGAGPPSEPIQVETFREDPPRAPFLSTTSITSSSITLEWKRDKDDINPVTGYILYCTTNEKDVKEKQCSAEQTNYTFHDLLCGFSYNIAISACNSIGCSEKRQISLKTQGSAPIAPDKESLLVSLNSTSVLINLSTFGNGGCTLRNYAVKYRRQHEKMWTRISDFIEPSQRFILIDGLHSKTLYHLQITAVSQAGASEAEYNFQTMPFEDPNPSPETVIFNESNLPLFMELEVILPLTLSGIVVVAVTLLVCVVMHKRQAPNSNSTMYNSNTNCNGDFHKGQSLPTSLDDENMHLSEMDNIKSHCKTGTLSQRQTQGPVTTCVYYPSPYATTQIDGTIEISHPLNQNCSDARYVSDDGQYATVKRTPRLPKTDLHIYNYPVNSHMAVQEEDSAALITYLVENGSNFPQSQCCSYISTQQCIDKS